MKIVQAYIAEKQAQIAIHPFFQRLQRNDPLRHVLPFASRLSFWVMTFQDVLRLNESKVTLPHLKKLARHHRAEDSGHDKWFMSDLLKIDGANPDVRSLFSKQHAMTRDASYALMSEVFLCQDDHERIILLLTLESAGHVFFERVVSYLERWGVEQSLQYFARSHIDVELSHAMFEKQMEEMLASIELESPLRERCMALVDRAYKSFEQIFDALESAVQAGITAAEDESSIRPDQRLLRHEADLRAMA